MAVFFVCGVIIGTQSDDQIRSLPVKDKDSSIMKLH